MADRKNAYGQGLDRPAAVTYLEVRNPSAGKEMPSSSVTAKGQTTIPKQIRDYLKLQPGNRIDYVVDESGNVVLRPATYHIRDLHGILHRPGQRPLKVEDMNRIIRQRHGSRS